MAERLLDRNIQQEETNWANTRNIVLDDIDPPDPGGRQIIIPRFPDRFPAPERPQRREISPYLPKNSPLEKAGFLLHRQMENFIEGVNSGSLEDAVVELVTEIRAHANEYTRERPLLEGSVKRTDRVVNKYNNEPVVNHLDWQEREGVTARGSLELERKVIDAKQGESVVQISPPGWNGLYPDYEKAQFVYFRVKDENSGELEQLTFVVNYSVEKCLDLLGAMGVNRADLVCADYRETIKKMVSQAVSLTSDRNGITGPKDFFNLVKKIGNRPGDSVFAVIERDLDRFLKGEDISALAPVCEDYLDSLGTFLSSNESRLGDFNFQTEVSDRVEETIYKIAEYIRGSRGGYSQPSSVILSEAKDIIRFFGLRPQNDRGENWRDQYKEVIGILQQISGCAGGGSRSRSSIRALGGIFSSGFSRSSLEAKFNKDGCTRCGARFVELECGVCSSCCTE